MFLWLNPTTMAIWNGSFLACLRQATSPILVCIPGEGNYKGLKPKHKNWGGAGGGVQRQGEGADRVLFMDKEVGTDGRSEAPGSLLWLSTKLPQGLPNTEKLHPEGLVPN